MSEKLKTRVESVTPKKAEKYLATGEGKNFRRISERRVKLYAQDMTDGKWALTGESIVFNTAGELIDGQHRLWAVIESGATVQMLVVEGVKSALHIDSGRPRTMAGWLEHVGYTNANLLAAALARAMIYNDLGYLPPDRTTKLGGIRTRERMLKFLADNPDLEKCCKIRLQVGRMCVLRAEPIGNRFLG